MTIKFAKMKTQRKKIMSVSKITLLLQTDNSAIDYV